MAFTRLAIAPAALVAALLGLAPAPALAAPALVVVELFTSQGCSSCPPAQDNLTAVSDRPGILALSFGVTYWNYLGWTDTFARPAYTERQRVYEAPLGENGPFTPQIVVNGRNTLVGDKLADVEAAIARAGRPSGPALTLSASAAGIGEGAAPRGGADIWLVRYDPRIVQVPVRRGENGGRTLPHKNVVHDLKLLGTWTGTAQNLPVPTGPDGLKTAILVQARGGGPILAAASD